jgi:BirA family biotin operon repressor/biotin-[acetyl-CoA-carboxylase] ligase
MSLSDFSFYEHHFSKLESTNIHARQLIHAKSAKEGDIFISEFQSKGKGQLQNSWHSEPGKNLLFSLVLEPNIPIQYQFFISMAVANSLKELVGQFTALCCEVKWPNDLLLNGNKIGGILIENHFSKGCIAHSVVGVGLNINQVIFPEELNWASSLAKETNENFELAAVLESWKPIFAAHYTLVRARNWQKIKQLYLDNLFLNGRLGRFEDAEGEFLAQIQGVNEQGYLLLERSSGLKEYELKQVRFIAKA